MAKLKTPKEMTETILKSLHKEDAPEGILIEVYLEEMISRHVTKALVIAYHDIEAECISETDQVKMETISNIFTKYGIDKTKLQ